MGNGASHVDGSSDDQKQSARPFRVCVDQQSNTISLMYFTEHRFITNVNLLFVLPQFLDPEDVEFLSVDVGQKTVRLPDGLAFRTAPAVSHQVHTVTCSQQTHHITNKRPGTVSFQAQVNFFC